MREWYEIEKPDIGRVVRIDPAAPGGYAPYLAGARADSLSGAPVFLGYEFGGVACGALVAACQKDVVILRWVSVSALARRLGIAGHLIEALCERAALAGAEEVVASVCLSEEDREIARALLEKHGFEIDDRDPVYSIRLSDVADGALKSHLAARSPRVAPLSELTPLQLREFQMRLAGEGYPWIKTEELYPEMSFFGMKDGKVAGCVLLAPCGEDVELRWLYGSEPAMLLEMLAAACVALQKERSGDTVIHAAAMTASVAELVKKLSGGKFTEEAQLLSFSRVLAEAEETAVS